MSLLDAIKFNEAGLVPTIAQDVETGRILMMAWSNAEAIRQTVETGFAHYYSRSRKTQWKKGETSGHVQKVLETYIDCDGDTLLMLVEQTGAACHTNHKSCFFQQLQGDAWVSIEDTLKDASE